MNIDTHKTRRLVAVFLLGELFYTYPILSLFNIEKMIFGIPILYFCLFAIWACLILLIIIMTRLRVRELDETQSPETGKDAEHQKDWGTWETLC